MIHNVFYCVISWNSWKERLHINDWGYILVHKNIFFINTITGKQARTICLKSVDFPECRKSYTAILNLKCIWILTDEDYCRVFLMGILIFQL